MGKAQDGAYRKGREAFETGKPESACPYADMRGGKHGHCITFSRGFRRAWYQGWRDAQQESAARDDQGDLTK